MFFRQITNDQIIFLIESSTGFKGQLQLFDNRLHKAMKQNRY